MPDPRSIPLVGGEIGERIRSFDWSATALGCLEEWPVCQVVAAGMVLENPVAQVLLWGSELVVCAYNEAYRPLLGDAAEALGRPFLDVWPGAREILAPLVATALRGESNRSEPGACACLGSGRPENPAFEFSFSPVRGDSGEVRGVLHTAVDTTSRLRAQREREESEARFRALVNATSDVVYCMSPDWSEMRSLDGRDFVADADGPSRSWLEDYVHPDDQPRMMDAIQKAVRRGSLFELEHRVRRADGTLGWTISRAIPLRDADGEIVEWFGAASDVTARKQSEDALRETDRARNEFLAVLGHELRNPLSPLRTGLDLLEDAANDPELLQSLRPMMDRQLSHLMRLVDDLLDVSRISRGRIDLQRASLDLGDPIRAAIEQTKELIAQRRHDLQIEASQAVLPVEGDVERLTQVFANLLSNAARYMEPGGTIRVRSGVEDGRAIVRVQDAGFGIPPERIGSLFELFSQIAEHRAQTGGGGLGIGLALSRRLVEMHGGTIEVESEGVGRGSVFTVRLPTSGDVRGAAESAQSVQRGPTRRVLVVDDNVDAAESLRMLLAMKGHRVQTVHDGPAALRHVERFVPHVVLLDLGLPQMDGIEVARRIRAMPGGNGMRLIAVTGWGQEEDRQRTLQAGIDEHLTKPVDARRLLELLDPGEG